METWCVRTGVPSASHAGSGLAPILTLVLSHQEGGWTAPLDIRELVAPGPDVIPGLADFLPAFSIHVVDLFELSNDYLMGASLPPFPKLALWLLRDARNHERMLANLPDWAPMFASVQAAPGGATALAQLVRYITLVMSEDIFDEIRDTLLSHLPETRTTLMTIAEALRKQGREQGLEQGLEQGRQAGLRVLRALVTKQLELRFGMLEPQHRQHLADASEGELERLGAGLLDAPSVVALFAIH